MLNREIKSSKRTQKEIELLAHEKMNAHPFTIDLLTSTIKFELDSNHFIHLGTNHNLKDIENIQIIENGEVSDFDQNKSQIESRDIMKYVILYTHEKKSFK